MHHPAEHGVNRPLCMTTKTPDNSFVSLLPEELLASLTAFGWACNGHIQAMASYENRVYQVGLDSGQYVVAKFYRPQRWTNEQILEEFEFTDELAGLDLPVLTPLRSPAGDVLCEHGAFRFSVYPKARGHAPSLDNPGQLEQIGRLIARIHSCGLARRFATRTVFTFEHRALDSARYLIDNQCVPDELCDAYLAIAEPVLAIIDQTMQTLRDESCGRIHGDMHAGNLLWTADGPAILDFDDACTGPAMQDLWMFLSGNRSEMQDNLNAIASGYEMFHPFPTAQLNLVESLRTQRIMYHTAWLARRWSDPAFPRAFPWFHTQKFWQEHILSLKEQLALLHEPALHLTG